MGKRKSLIEEREKRIKKSFTQWTVTVYICTVTVHLQDHHVYLNIFTKIDMEGFWNKMCKLEYFLYLRWIFTSRWDALEDKYEGKEQTAWVVKTQRDKIEGRDVKDRPIV